MAVDHDPRVVAGGDLFQEAGKLPVRLPRFSKMEGSRGLVKDPAHRVRFIGEVVGR